jgi:hypothetical protein
MLREYWSAMARESANELAWRSANRFGSAKPEAMGWQWLSAAAGWLSQLEFPSGLASHLIHISALAQSSHCWHIPRPPAPRRKPQTSGVHSGSRSMCFHSASEMRRHASALHRNRQDLHKSKQVIPARKPCLLQSDNDRLHPPEALFRQWWSNRWNSRRDPHC